MVTNLPLCEWGWKECMKKESLSEVVKKWQTDEQNYAKRQMVWFKKMPVIWFDISQPGFYTEIEKEYFKNLTE